MKRLLAIMVSVGILIMLCACNANLSLESDQSENGNNETETTNNPFSGVWEYLLNSSLPIRRLLVLNNDCTWFGIVEETANYEDDVEMVPGGTYEIISDSEFRIVEMTEDGEEVADEATCSVSDGIMYVEGEAVWQRVETSRDMSKSIVGTWERYDHETFLLQIGSRVGTVGDIVFYNDGSYTTNPTSHYGRYSVVQDGNAVQIFSSDGRYEILIKIDYVGYGLAIFDGTYLMQRKAQQ